MINVEQAQPALLAVSKADGAAEFHQFGLAEVAVHAPPETVVGVGAPDDGFGIGERGFLAFTVVGGFFKIHQVIDLSLLQPGLLAFDRTLVAAEFANHCARHVEPAHLLDRVIKNAVAKYIVPGIGEEPEAGRHMGAHGGAFRSRCALARAAFHLRTHFRCHFFQRYVADTLCGHGDTPPLKFRFLWVQR